MKILAFESSCDETAVAVVEDGRRVLSDAIASQADMHALYGGVVPEIASRAHTEAIQPIVREALEKAGKKIMFEAQLGALRDIDFGIYPYTSSSSSIAGYACVGAGMPGSHVDRTVGIVKAYSTCVGEGPFTAEWFGEEAENLREKGGEYGASTGRPRRVGPIDLVATRYGCRIQGATEVALTKLDVLSGMKEVPLCVQYELNGALTDDFPFPAILPEAKPVFRTMLGWNCDISGVRRYEDLPKEARDYVETVEKAIGCHISYVSVGAEREAIITR